MAKKTTELKRKAPPKKRVSGLKSGKPEFIPTDSQRYAVIGMKAAGFPLEEIAKCIINEATKNPISHTTLSKVFRDELDNSAELAKSRVKNMAFLMACSGKDTAMTIFYLKTQCGWKEPAIEVKGEFTLEQLVNGAHKIRAHPTEL